MEFRALAEQLQPYTAHTMKLEVAPWIRDYTVDMDYLYTDLKMEKVTRTPKGTTKRKLENYGDMFFSQKSQKQQFGNKILLVSDPHYGKTSIAKKINWDWARGIFTTFTVVFFVFLKLVRPGDTIENIIIEQTPALEAMGISPQRLKRILETFGDKCLIMLDGLDDHALGSNQDILKIVQGRKLLQCGIIATSRPHNTTEIQRYFSMIVNIQGFTRGLAEQFANKLLGDPEKVLAVMQFSPYSSEEYHPWHQCPILLSFLCILVRDDHTNLSKIPLGEIYTRLLRCLYRKFTIRKGVEYQTAEFIRMLQGVGKIALKVLKFGNSMNRSDVIQELGGDAFNYGLLIGRPRSGIAADESGDISVTFLEKGMQDFLGAFFFTNMLDNGESLEELLGHNQENPVITSNPLFLQICLWLLKKSEGYFSFRNAENVSQQLQDFFAEQLVKQEKVWDVSSLCSTLNFPDDAVSEKELTHVFFEDVVVQLQKVMKSYEPASTKLSAETEDKEQKTGTSGM